MKRKMFKGFRKPLSKTGGMTFFHLENVNINKTVCRNF